MVTAGSAPSSPPPAPHTCTPPTTAVLGPLSRPCRGDHTTRPTRQNTVGWGRAGAVTAPGLWAGEQLPGASDHCYSLDTRPWLLRSPLKVHSQFCVCVSEHAA